MKVVHLNASDKGGASIVAQRLNEALNAYTDVNSHHLIFSGNSKGLLETTFWANSPLKKIRAFLNHALDKFDFLQYERNAEIRFQFNHARMGIDISHHPLIKEADIIHIHWVLKGFLSFETVEKLTHLGKPIVWTCHDLWPFTGGCFYLWGCENLPGGCGNCPYMNNPSPNDISHFLLLNKIKLFERANVNWVSPSRWLSDIARTSPVLNSNTIFSVIPNPIRVSDYEVAELNTKNKLKTEMGLKPEIFTILFSAANLENPAKGFNDFKNIMNLLTGFDVQVIVVGRSKKDVQLPLPFYYAGYVRETARVKELFAASDLYITTSHEDNLPTTVMESLACGVPALGYAIGGVPELISHGETGFIFPKGDFNAMANGVKELLNNPTLQKEFSLNSRLKAENTYDESVVSKDYASLYKQIAGRETN